MLIHLMLYLIKFLDNNYNSLNNDLTIVAFFLEFFNAFNTFNHQIYLQNLHYYKIRGTPFDWFKSYLSQRRKYVSINNNNSPTLAVQFGALQGYTKPFTFPTAC